MPPASVAHGAQTTLVEVDALPAHGDLEYPAQLTQGAARGHQHPPPHHGADVEQPNFHLHDRADIRRAWRGASFRRGCFGSRFIRPDYSLSSRPVSATPHILMLSYLCIQRIEQRPCFLQIGRVEAFGEPPINGRKTVVGFGMAALVAAEPGEAYGRAQFPELGILLPGNA